MRGSDAKSGSLFSCVDLEDRMRAKCSLRTEQQDWLAAKADKQAEQVVHLAKLRGIGWDTMRRACQGNAVSRL